MKNAFITFVVLFFAIFSYAQDTITAQFSPKEAAQFALLYKITPTGQLHASGASKRDQNENFQVLLTPDWKAGIYKLVYANPIKEKLVYLFYDGKSNVSFNFSQDKGVVFNDIANQNLQKLLSIRHHFYHLLTDSVTVQKIHAFIAKNNPIQQTIISSSNDTLLKSFLKGISVSFPKEVSSYAALLDHVKTHYWKNSSKEMILLQASPYPFLFAKNYYSLFAKGKNDSILTQTTIDHIMLAIQRGSTSFQLSFLKNFWQYLQPLGNEKALTYLAKKYFIQTASLMKRSSLVQQLKRFLSLSIGSKLPNAELASSLAPQLPKSLYDLSGSNYYLIVFWNASCSHCLEELPKVDNIIGTISPSEMKGITIALEHNAGVWLTKTQLLPNFMNSIAVDERKIQISNRFDIEQYPTYFIVDKSMKIIAKPHSFESLQEEFKRLSTPQD